jgi:hypothetical protein
MDILSFDRVRQLTSFNWSNGVLEQWVSQYSSTQELFSR